MLCPNSQRVGFSVVSFRMRWNATGGVRGAVLTAGLAAGMACSGQGSKGQPAAGTDGGAVSGAEGGGGAQCDAGSGASLDCTNPTDPVAYGQCEVGAALSAVGTMTPVIVETADAADASAALAALASTGVTLDPRAESFVLASDSTATRVIGRDPVGAMYGAFELAEDLRLDGAVALPLSSPVSRSPNTALRAANLFLVLPASNEQSWWFLDEEFWREYLDMCAHARLDFLDLHGMYNLGNTVFPNALLYFATSASHPEIGVASADRERNLAMLNTIVAMATARGIKVGLMTYRSDASPTGDTLMSPPDDATLQQYTREAAQDLATRAPGLWRLGFRIGESTQQDAGWYTGTFVAGVEAAGTGVGISTRTWYVLKKDLLPVAAAGGPDTIVEAKYNGEHLGPPYIIEGGQMGNTWTWYSYQDYLEAPAPYVFVWQVRTGGTHRIFRQASFERARRVAGTYRLSRYAQGFTLEPPHAYFPQRDYYHAAVDAFSPWTFRRDELLYHLFGRLGYDPTTSDRVFRALLAKRVGTDALWDAVQAASEIVPWIQTAHTCGPDARDFAPDLEWGGPLGYWASPMNAPASQGVCSSSHQPFDTFAFALPFEAASDLVAGRATSRVTPIEVANRVLDAASRARGATGVTTDSCNAEARDVVRECVAQADLGEYFAHKLRAATALAVYSQTGSADYLAAARSENAAATAAFGSLASDTAYIAPFDERLRMISMGLSPFHWQEELPRLADDAASIDAAVATVAAAPPNYQGALPSAQSWFTTPRGAGPGLAAIAIDPPDPAAASWNVTVSLASAVSPSATVNVLWKPFTAVSDWQAVPAQPVAGGAFVATVPGGGGGALFAVELVLGPGFAWRYPDVLSTTPYVTLPPP